MVYTNMTCRACGERTYRFEPADTCEKCLKEARERAVAESPDNVSVHLSVSARRLELEINGDRFEVAFTDEAFLALLGSTTVNTDREIQGVRVSQGVSVQFSPRVCERWREQAAKAIEAHEGRAGAPSTDENGGG